MAGTATVTTTDAARRFKKYSIAWVSTAGGAVSANAFQVVAGLIHTVKIVPGAGGVAPTTLYDILLNDADTVDLLNARGGDCSATAGEILQFDPPLFVPLGTTLDLVVANAGASKEGRVDVCIEAVSN